MKKITLIMIAVLWSCFTFAQSDTSRADLAYLFQNLNKANIPLGYLAEWGTASFAVITFKGFNIKLFRFLSCPTGFA